MKNYKRVALIGLDGSGKSANINAMKQDIDYSDYNFMWVRWEPKLLKPAYWFLGKKVKSSKSQSIENISAKYHQKDTEEQKQMSAEYTAKTGLKGKIFKSPVVRTLWMFFALLDYFFQFYAKTIKILIKKENVIFDRFYLDLFVDQGINFGYSPEKIDSEVKKYQKLFPRIKQMIYLRVSPETCYQRKDDIPNMDYLLRRYAIYEKLSQNPGWVIIDGEEPFDVVYLNIKKHIL